MLGKHFSEELHPQVELRFLLSRIGTKKVNLPKLRVLYIVLDKKTMEISRLAISLFLMKNKWDKTPQYLL